MKQRRRTRMTKNKLEDLQNKKSRMEKELATAKGRLDTLKQAVTKKEMDIKQLEAEIVSTLLVENNLSFSELTALLGEERQRNTEG